MGGGTIPVVTSGCGTGGAVAWTHTFKAPASAPATESFQLGAMVAGPQGHVGIGASVASSTMCTCPGLVLDASGVEGASPPSQGVPSGACAASITPAGFGRTDGLLYGFEHQTSKATGPATSGFLGEKANVSIDGTVTAGPVVQSKLLGADAAGDLFAQVTVTPPGATADFGMGPVSGTVMLRYDPSGALVTDTLPVATGSFAVGALGHLFYATQVTSAVDQGCGIVGAAGAARTIVTKRDAAGACVWSRALPAGAVMSIDPSENVLLAATFAGSADFGGGPLVAAGTSDLGLGKLDASGSHVWSHRFGAAGASVSGVSAFGATSTGGASLAATLSGAVDFGCGAVTSSADATTLFASFDASGNVAYSRVVELLAGVAAAGPAVDGLGGIYYAVQQKVMSNCACMNTMQCSIGDQCVGGMCLQCQLTSNQPGDILVSRFSP